MKFKFTFPSVVIEARGVEEALQAVASHISTAARHVSNGHDHDDFSQEFSLTEAGKDDKVVDLNHDPIVKEHGPAPLDLDPKSPAGIAHVAQLEERATEAEAAKPPAKDLRTDAENLALHSADEQAKLTKKEA